MRILLLCILLAIPNAYADLTGRVAAVTDGDTSPLRMRPRPGSGVYGQILIRLIPMTGGNPRNRVTFALAGLQRPIR